MTSMKRSKHGSQCTLALKGLRTQDHGHVKFAGINEQIYHLNHDKTLI